MKQVERDKDEPEGYPQFEGLGLNMNQQRFVIAYCDLHSGKNATRAYMKVYDGEYETCTTNAARLLKYPNIDKAIQIETARQLSNYDAVAKVIMQSWIETITADYTEAFDVNGPFATFKKREDIPDYMKPLIQSIRNTASGGVEVVFCSKDKAKENLAKTLGMFVDTNRSVGDDYESIVDRIRRDETDGSAGNP